MVASSQCFIEGIQWVGGPSMGPIWHVSKTMWPRVVQWLKMMSEWVSSIRLEGVDTCTWNCPLVIASLRKPVDTECEQGLLVFVCLKTTRQQIHKWLYTVSCTAGLLCINCLFGHSGRGTSTDILSPSKSCHSGCVNKQTNNIDNCLPACCLVLGR